MMDSMVGMKGIWRGLLGDIVDRNTFETGCQQGLGIGEEVAHDRIDGANDAALDVAGIALGADQQALAHGAVNGVEADLLGRAQ